MATIDEIFKVHKRQQVKHAKRSKESAIVSKTDPSCSDTSDVGPAVELTTDLQKLREFDLNSKYGPCSGLTRMERWLRAEKFNFNPPNYIRDIIEKHSNDERYTQNIWCDIKI